MGGDVDAVCAAAADETGLDDFGDDWFLTPLGAFLADLDEPHLNDFGRSFLRRQAVRDVARRLRVLATLRAHPEILDVQLPPIIYVTGMARSGTTLLHNLLALHPDARALLRWELMEPVPPPVADTYSSDPRIDEVQAAVDKLRGSNLERMHWVNADEPEECPWGFVDAVSMLGQGVMGCLPAWRRFLTTADHTVAFEHYRDLVKLLLWRNPAPAGGFLVLKAPQVARSVAELAHVLPEAHFVVADRDPFRCVVSTAAVMEMIAAPFCGENPMTDDGARSQVVGTLVAEQLDAIDAFSTAEPDRISHVAYPRLVAQPSALVSDVLAAVDVAMGDVEARVEAFLAAQRAGARKAPLELGSMGYDDDRFRAQPAIARYCRRFGVEPEQTRLTGAAPSA